MTLDLKGPRDRGALTSANLSKFMSGEKIYLVDGSGYIFRAFYAVAPLSTKAGFPTNALFGFTRMLKKLLKESESEHVAVAFDLGRDTFRLEMYPEYKANRQECPPELLQQMPYFREIALALGLKVLELKGYEADDVIGTLAHRLSNAGRSVVIVTGDKDLMQLVNDKVSIWDTLNDRRYGAAEVKAKMGVGPELIVDLLGLMGDSSDNVPGLNGVGPKTAVQLLEKFGSIENLLKSVEALKADSTIRNRSKIAEQIELSTETVRLSRRLVEVHTQAPIELDVNGEIMRADALDDVQLYETIKRTSPRQDLLKDLVERFEFESLLSDVRAAPSLAEQISLFDSTPKGAAYKTITAEEFPAWVEKLRNASSFAFDLETTSLDVFDARIVGASFCWNKDEAFYLPFAHKEGSNQVKLDTFISACKPIFSSEAIEKCGQNLKYDIQVMAQHGVPVRKATFDTMVAAYLVKPDFGSYNLTTLADLYLQLPIIEFDEVLGEGSDFSEVSIERATRYACQDAHYAWLLRLELEPKLKALGLEQVFQEIEMPLVSVLSRVERNGIALDTTLLKNMSDKFEAELEDLRKNIFEMAGVEFNINSPKQLAEVLFERLKLSTKGLKKTKTGISTDSSVLEKLSEDHPLPGLILQHRFLFKLKSTYIDALPAQINPKTERLHTRLNQTVAGTGRLSSSEPNLQNIPIMTEEGRRIRGGFVAPPGKLLISADYSQIELRLLAHLSGDKNLISAFKEDVDVHARTARELFNIGPILQVTPEQRRFGKTINFGIIYGMGPYRLSRDLGISFSQAQQYIDQYFASFKGVKQFFDNLERDSIKQGFVTTLAGRKRFLADIDSSGRDQGFVNRAAMNAPLQGSAADIIKKAMNALDARIEKEELPCLMILQIHDELLFECEEKFVDKVKAIIVEEMENVFPLQVPLKVDVGVGKNWEQAH